MQDLEDHFRLNYRKVAKIFPLIAGAAKTKKSMQKSQINKIILGLRISKLDCR